MNRADHRQAGRLGQWHLNPLMRRTTINRPSPAVAYRPNSLLRPVAVLNHKENRDYGGCNGSDVCQQSASRFSAGRIIQ